jgi:hypothetical protein
MINFFIFKILKIKIKKLITNQVGKQTTGRSRSEQSVRGMVDRAVGRLVGWPIDQLVNEVFILRLRFKFWANRHNVERRADE